jgi:hypothetical protein
VQIDRSLRGIHQQVGIIVKWVEGDHLKTLASVERFWAKFAKPSRPVEIRGLISGLLARWGRVASRYCVVLKCGWVERKWGI